MAKGNPHPVDSFKPGPDPRRGHGKKGRSGPPSGDVREMFIAVSREKNYAMVRTIAAIANDPTHKDCIKAAALVLAYAIGQPKQSVELSGTDTGPALTVVVQRAADAEAA